MPWLTGTAFLHSVMIQEKRGMLKVWNVSLVLATGVLAILGTFLVRSGILESIHAFGASTLGIPFLVLIGLMIAGSVALVVCRVEGPAVGEPAGLAAERARPIFLLNNLVLVAMCVVIFWFTFWPLISEALGVRARRRPADLQQLDRPAGHPARAADRARAGARLAAGDGGEPAPPVRRAGHRCGGRARVALIVTGTGDVKTGLLFCFAAFSATVLGQEYVRGDARAAGHGVASRCRSRSSRWCAATGVATAATSSTSA